MRKRLRGIYRFDVSVFLGLAEFVNPTIRASICWGSFLTRNIQLTQLTELEGCFAQLVNLGVIRWNDE
jgi:hypothetical protein